MKKVLVVIGSVREGRVGKPVADMVTRQLDELGATYEVADLKELDLPFVNQETIPSAANKQYEDERVQRWSKMVDDAEAVILISAEYNHSPPASLKNAIDWLYPEWENKPVALVAYGGMGGTRAMYQLKINILQVKAFPLAEIPIPGPRDYITDGVMHNEKAEENIKKAYETLQKFTFS